MKQRIANLIGRQRHAVSRQRCTRLTHLARAEVTDTHGPDPPPVNRFGQDIHDRADGSLVPVCPVELIKVDRGKPEPLQASSECLADCGWSTAARERCILGRDRQRPTTSAREGAKELLSFAPAIRLGGIEQVETCLQAGLERTDHVLGAVVLAIAPVALVTPSPASDAEANYPQRTVAQLNGWSHAPFRLSLTACRRIKSGPTARDDSGVRVDTLDGRREGSLEQEVELEHRADGAPRARGLAIPRLPPTMREEVDRRGLSLDVHARVRLAQRIDVHEAPAGRASHPGRMVRGDGEVLPSRQELEICRRADDRASLPL